MSLRARLTGWYILLLAAILAAFSASVYLSLAYAVRGQLDDSLRTVGHLLVEEVDIRDGQAIPDFDPLPSDLRVALYDRAGRLLFSHGELPGPLAPGYRTVEWEGQSWRQFATPLPQGLGLVVVMRSEETLDNLLAQLHFRLLVSVPVTLLVAAWGGWFLASRALGPIDEVTRTAAAIEAASDLTQRLRPVRVKDELGRLVTTLNAMLGRLEASFARQRQFTADAAHQLRTPLAVVRGRAELTLKRPRSEGEYREALADIFAHSEHMTQLVSKLLRLARGDAGVPLELETLDLATVAGSVAESMRARAEEAGLELRVGPLDAAPVEADQTGIIELVFSLLDNAIKFTPPGGVVTVSTGPTFVKIQDTGCGIEQDQTELIFERFHRLGVERQGTGLGLAICRNIAHDHRGRITVDSRPGEGSTFTFQL